MGHQDGNPTNSCVKQGLLIHGLSPRAKSVHLQAQLNPGAQTSVRGCLKQMCAPSVHSPRPPAQTPHSNPTCLAGSELLREELLAPSTRLCAQGPVPSALSGQLVQWRKWGGVSAGRPRAAPAWAGGCVWGSVCANGPRLLTHLRGGGPCLCRGLTLHTYPALSTCPNRRLLPGVCNSSRDLPPQGPWRWREKWSASSLAGRTVPERPWVCSFTGHSSLASSLLGWLPSSPMYPAF